MTSPYAQAHAVHTAAAMPHSFREAVEAHALTGYVHISPHLFLLARRVGSGWIDDDLLDPWLVAPDGDAWHCHLAAGDLREALRIAPYRLPWLSYFHDGKKRLMRLSSFISRSQWD